MPATQPEFFTAQELAALLKVNVITIYRYIKAGTLRAHKLGKEFRISREDLDEWLKRASTSPRLPIDTEGGKVLGT